MGLEVKQNVYIIVPSINILISSLQTLVGIEEDQKKKEKEFFIPGPYHLVGFK